MISMKESMGKKGRSDRVFGNLEGKVLKKTNVYIYTQKRVVNTIIIIIQSKDKNLYCEDDSTALFTKIHNQGIRQCV